MKKTICIFHLSKATYHLPSLTSQLHLILDVSCFLLSNKGRRVELCLHWQPNILGPCFRLHLPHQPPPSMDYTALTQKLFFHPRS